MDESSARQFFHEIKKLGISHPEWAILDCASASPKPMSGVAAIAASWSEGDPRGTLSRSQCQEGLEGSLRKGLVRLVNEQVLSEILAFLRAHPAVGPIYGLPRVGDVDVTSQGVSILRALDVAGSGYQRAEDACYERETRVEKEIYCPTAQLASGTYEVLKTTPGIVAVDEPVVIGPWRVSWWQRFETGYVIKTISEDPTSGIGELEGK